MLSHFFGVELTSAAIPPQTIKMPRKTGSKNIVDLASIMNWILMETLHLYENNRGDGRTSPVTFASASQGVNSDAAGEIIIGMHGEEPDRRMTLANGHSRLAGFFRRLVNGELSQRELATTMYVTVTNDFMESYRLVNSAPAHRTKDKIKNKDLTYGRVINSIFQSLGEDCAKLIGENKWTVLSSIIFHLNSADSDWFWPHVYQKRTSAMKNANELAGALKISSTDEQRLISAVEFWHETMRAIESQGTLTGIAQKSIQKVVGNAGLFGFLVCDQLSTRPQMPSSSILAKKILRNVTVVERACPELCRGDRETVIRYTTEIERIFKQKGKSVA